MAQKRTAATELHHENWDIEEEPETLGVFKTASSAVLAKRQIKQGTRRLKKVDDVSTKGAGIFQSINLIPSSSKGAGNSFFPGLNFKGSSSNVFGLKDTKSNEADALVPSKTEDSSKATENTETNGANANNIWDIKSPKPFASMKLTYPGLSEPKEMVPATESLNTNSVFSTSNTSDVNSFMSSNKFVTSINSSGNDSIKDPPAFSIKPFTNLLSQKQVSAEPTTSAWPTPLRCLEISETAPSTSTAHSQSRSDEINKIDSRHLLKPVPDEILKRLQTKSSVTGKSLNFLQRTYQLNMTFLDWTSLLIQQDLTINIAEIVPSYLEELITLMNKEIESQKLEKADDGFYSQYLVLKKMLEVFKLFGIGSDDPVTKPLTLAKRQDSADVPPLSTSSNSTPASSASTLLPTSAFVIKTNQTTESSEDQKVDEENEDETPKVVFKPIVEEGATFTMRCKVFIKKTDPKTNETSFVDHGVGTLSIKPISEGKVQLVVRAENSLGNILLNVCITSKMPVQMANPNTVMLVCPPLPTDSDPKTILLRVKTKDDGKLLHDKLTIL